jgi:oxygen-independent coproporphyrinogen-3 oxidase
VRYLDALAAEVRAHRWEWQPETVYLGGGTPSTIDADALAALLEPLPGRPWREATIEVAPGTITAAKARAWARCGINRVSLGVQSFIEPEVRRTGRKHTAQTVVDEVRLLRDAGIRNFNIDLIAGLSGQTETTWRESLDWIRRIAPMHVSVYMLEVDEDSRLGKELLLGGVRYGAADIPADGDIAAFYEMAVELLAGVGIRRYEISNFAVPGWESHHNLKYWKLAPYVGFGADAHSFDGRMRRQNPESVVEYLADNSEQVEEVPHEDERFFVGLRMMEGIRPEPEEWRRFEEPIRRFVGAGLLETEDGVLRLTGRGVLFSNEVFQEFLN